MFIALKEIEHRRTKVNCPRTNGFVERFHRTVLDEFFRVKLRTTLYESLEALQADLDGGLADYNQERPHLGYRNRGRRPIDTVNDYLIARSPSELSTSIVRQEAQEYWQPNGPPIANHFCTQELRKSPHLTGELYPFTLCEAAPLTNYGQGAG
jgi:hypothetical protein